jgi:hypothetical protein
MRWLRDARGRRSLKNGMVLGLGFTTRIGFWLWYVVPVTALASGDARVGASVWGLYGFARGISPLGLTSAASDERASSRPGSDSCPRCTSRARAKRAARSPRPAPATPADCSSKRPGTTRAHRGSERRSTAATTANPITYPDRLARSVPPLPTAPALARPRQTRQHRRRCRRPRARLLPLGRDHGLTTPNRPPREEDAGTESCRHARQLYEQTKVVNARS